MLDAADEADTFDVTFAVDADKEDDPRCDPGSELPDGIRAIGRAVFRRGTGGEVRDGLGFITTFLFVFAAVSVVVGVFVVYNAFRTVIGQRTRELALFRLLGATRRQVLGGVIFEAIVIVGVIATAVGIPAGLRLAALLRTVLDLVGSGISPGCRTLDLRTAPSPPPWGWSPLSSAPSSRRSVPRGWLLSPRSPTSTRGPPIRRWRGPGRYRFWPLVQACHCGL